MPNDKNYHTMRRVIRDAALPENQLIDILATFLCRMDQEKATSWLSEMKERNAELERRSQELLNQFKAIELSRFDPMI